MTGISYARHPKWKADSSGHGSAPWQRGQRKPYGQRRANKYSRQASGTIGALLRREGLYSSHLTTWKRQRQKGEIDALTPQKRGPKVVVSPRAIA